MKTISFKNVSSKFWENDKLRKVIIDNSGISFCIKKSDTKELYYTTYLYSEIKEFLLNIKDISFYGENEAEISITLNTNEKISFNINATNFLGLSTACDLQKANINKLLVIKDILPNFQFKYKSCDETYIEEMKNTLKYGKYGKYLKSKPMTIFCFVTICVSIPFLYLSYIEFKIDASFDIIEIICNLFMLILINITFGLTGLWCLYDFIMNLLARIHLKKWD